MRLMREPSQYTANSTHRKHFRQLSCYTTAHLEESIGAHYTTYIYDKAKLSLFFRRDRHAYVTVYMAI